MGEKAIIDVLRAGVVGLDNDGQMLLARLAEHPAYQVVAVGDRDKERVDPATQRFGMAGYDDFRSMLVREKLDILFLMAPANECGECFTLAARAGMHVVKRWPVARSQPEAKQWGDLLGDHHRFYVLAPWRFAPAYHRAGQLLAEQKVGTLYLVRAEVMTTRSGSLEWRGDPVLAGGGALLELGYSMIDLMIAALGPPDRVFNLMTMRCSKRVLPPSRTEDTATLVMNFSEGVVGNLVCSWMSVPSGERIIFHGTQGALEVQPDRLRLYDVEGRLVQEESFPADPAELVVRELTHIADSLRQPEVKPVSLAVDHLINMAVIESAYLSSRTQMPENLKIYGSMVAGD